MATMKAVFSGIDSSGLRNLWVTDGTDAGTSELAVANANSGGIAPTFLTTFGALVAFNGTDAAGHTSLWITDGTAAGTSELSVPGAFSGGLIPGPPVVFDGKLYFSGLDASLHSALWVSDGTNAGTTELAITGTSTTGINAQNLTVIGNALYFSGRDPSGNHALWVSDGTGPGTSMLAIANVGPNGLSPDNFVQFGDKVVFTGFNAINSKALWISDGTAVGTSEIPVTGASSVGGLQPQYLTVFGDKIYFQGFFAPGKSGLWVTDGTSAGTVQLDIAGASALFGLSPQFIINTGTSLVFDGRNPFSQGALWVSDGTAAGTSEVPVTGAHPFGLGPSDLKQVGNQIYFAGNDAAGNRGLWVTDGTTAGTVELNTTGAGTGGITPNSFAAVGLPLVTGSGPCYAAGTRIATPSGPIPVEHLQPGDLVTTLSGPSPVLWLGHRHLCLTNHPRPHDVRPIRIAPDAFGPGLPHAPLRLSPDHAVFVEDHLIPIRYLLNGATIVREDDCPDVTSFHIELDRHDILFAEGLPAESYLDTGNRADFANGGQVARMTPDFALRTWETDSCAPLLRDGPTLSAIRARLKARALMLGHRLSEDPQLRILAAGQTLAQTAITLTSRTAIPAQLRRDDPDHRRLGLCVERIVVDGEDVPLDDPRLTTGWHALEGNHRWTDGAARIVSSAPMRSIRLELTPALSYWTAPAQLAKRAKLTASTL